MRAEDAFKNMTAEAKAQAIRDILVLLKERDLGKSPDYVEQVVNGLRKHPCGQEIAKVISGYFRGIVGMNVGPEEVTGMRLKPGEEGTSSAPAKAASA